MRWHCGPQNYISSPLSNFHTELQELRVFVFRSVFSNRIRVSPPTHSHSLGYHMHSAPGDHFSHITSRYACSCSKLSNNCYMFIIFRYCSHRVFGFNVCRYLALTNPCIPFRYMLDTSMYSFPLNINCIFQFHPSTSAYRIPPSGSAVLSPLLHFQYYHPVALFPT